MKKILLIALGSIAFLVIWFLTEENDYFISDYKDLTLNEKSEFTKEPNPTLSYISHFGDPEFLFPRQEVDKIKIFENKPIIGTFTSKTLNKKFNTDLIQFFNDSTNFWWGETTWLYRESEYILRFYSEDKIVGKIYLCLDNCGMIDTKPFTPNVKFGGLTNEGQKKLESIIEDKYKWD